MATIAVGDIHGNAAALNDLLGQITCTVSDEDTVVFLGDYIDVGANSKECVDAILAFRREVRASVVSLCGNHEDWLLRTLHDHCRHSWLLGMGAFDTIRSYSPGAAQVLREAVEKAGPELLLAHGPLPYSVFFESIPDDHLRFFENLAPYCRTADCLCVHGGLNPLVPRVEDQRRQDLLWGVDGFPHCYYGMEVVLYGHWNNPVIDADGWPRPRIVGGTIGLDTVAHGVLTAMRLPDARVFQSARHQAPV